MSRRHACLFVGGVVLGFVLFTSPLWLGQAFAAQPAGPVARAPVVRMLPPVGDFPDAPCTLANRMNIFIAEDGTMFECVCEALTQGHVCSWYHVADGPGAQLRRRLKARLHLRVLPRMVVLRV